MANSQHEAQNWVFRCCSIARIELCYLALPIALPSPIRIYLEDNLRETRRVGIFQWKTHSRGVCDSCETDRCDPNDRRREFNGCAN